MSLLDELEAAQASSQQLQEQNMLMQEQNMMMQEQMQMQNNMMQMQGGMMADPMYSQPMFMQQPMMMPQMQSMQMCRYDRYGNYIPPKFSKVQLLQYMRDYIVNSTGRPISREEKLDDAPPQTLRHCCVEAKITSLPLNTFQAQSDGMPVNIQFYFCKACGKLIYVRDFM